MTDREMLWNLMDWFREIHRHHSVHCPSAKGEPCTCWMSSAYDPNKLETTLPGATQRTFVDVDRRDRPDRRAPVPTTTPTEGAWPRVNLHVRLTTDGVVNTDTLRRVRQTLYNALQGACEAEGIDHAVWWLDTRGPFHTLLTDLYALVDTGAPDTVIKADGPRFTDYSRRDNDTNGSQIRARPAQFARRTRSHQ